MDRIVLLCLIQPEVILPMAQDVNGTVTEFSVVLLDI